MFIVPRQRLAVSARYLSTHYGRTRCWAFPDPEREVFDQVVLMAYRKADPVPDAHAESMVLEWAAGEPEPMRPDPYPPFTPKTTPSGDILFTTRTVDPVAAAAEARRSGLWTSTEITDTLWPLQEPVALRAVLIFEVQSNYFPRISKAEFHALRGTEIVAHGNACFFQLYPPIFAVVVPD